MHIPLNILQLVVASGTLFAFQQFPVISRESCPKVDAPISMSGMSGTYDADGYGQEQ